MGYARSSLAAAFGLLAGLAASGCSHTIVLDTSRLDVVPLGEFDAYMKDKGNPFADPEKRVVIRVPAGQPIPLELSLKVPFADLEGGPYAVRFRRDVFICLGRGTMLLGFDGRTFAAIDDMRGLKQVAGVERGKLEMGFGVKQSEGAKISVGLEAQ